jgi:hypothetical protein
MTADIRTLKIAQPFVPFTIHTAEGEQCRVRTSDHVAVSPNRARVLVFGEDGGWQMITASLIAGVTMDRDEQVTQGEP